MIEFATYVCMAPEEYQFQHGMGQIAVSSAVDHYRQPGVVGLYGRGCKPIFIHNTPEEKLALESGDVEAYFAIKGYTHTVVDNVPPEGKRRTIP